MSVVVPQDWVEGQQLRVAMPSGQHVAYNVPPGTRPGGTFNIVPPR